jgi:hypothetical protein
MKQGSIQKEENTFYLPEMLVHVILMGDITVKKGPGSGDTVYCKDSPVYEDSQPGTPDVC